VIAPTPTAVEPAPVEVLNWQREGGIAGFCDGVTLFADGGIRVTSCRSTEAKTGRLSGAQMDRVLAWVVRLASFERVQSDGAVADGMTVRLTFTGQGTQAASEADVQAMQEFAASLLPPPPAPDAWPVYTFPIGASVDYPAGWSYAPDVYDEVQYSVSFFALETDGSPVRVEVYHRPVSERDVADPFTWQPNQGGYEVHWSRPITSEQGLAGIEFVWGAYVEARQEWDTPPQWMAVYYSPEDELDVRLSAFFDQAALDLLERSGVTETVAAHFALPRRMAQSVQLYPTAGWELYRDTEADGLFELKHPPGWTVQAERFDCALHYKLDWLTLLVFEGCPAGAGGDTLTFFDTLQRFREGLRGPAAVDRRTADGMQVEVIHYAAAGETGIMALYPGPGTAALWQVGEQGFALVDEENRYQADGTFDGVLGTFRLLPPMPRAQPRPLEGRAAEGGIAFDLPGVGATIVLPEGYSVLTNNEYNRRGSLVSFDVAPADRAAPYLGEIQFFSESSLRTFQERCDVGGWGYCFEGDYPDLDRFRAFRAAIDPCAAPAPYEAGQFGGRCYLVGTHRCMGDLCVLREYTTFLNDRMVSLIVVQENASQENASDELFASFELVSSDAGQSE